MNADLLCMGCGKYREPWEFEHHPTAKSGHYSKCYECRKKKAFRRKREKYRIEHGHLF